MGTPVIRLSDAHVTFGDHGARHHALCGIDLDIDRGELVTIVGASGSGKSTLLHVLAGLQPLDSGHLEIDTSIGVHRPAIVFQEPLLLPWRSVLDNVALGLGYRRTTRRRPGRRDRRERAREVLSKVGIETLADRFPHQLSGGQAQRVAIARTIAIETPILLLDEPFGALDPRTRRELQDWLSELRGRLGLTIVLVTHDVDEALHLGDRVAVLAAGRGELELIDTAAATRGTPDAGATRQDVLGRLGVPLATAI